LQEGKTLTLLIIAGVVELRIFGVIARRVKARMSDDDKLIYPKEKALDRAREGKGEWNKWAAIDRNMHVGCGDLTAEIGFCLTINNALDQSIQFIILAVHKHPELCHRGTFLEQ